MNKPIPVPQERKFLTFAQAKMIKATIKTQFPDVDVTIREERTADYQTETFIEHGQVSLYEEGHCVVVFSKVGEFEAFLTVVSKIATALAFHETHEHYEEPGTPEEEEYIKRVIDNIQHD